MYYLFVVPPFYETANPAIGVSNLLTLTRNMGFRSKILYENVSLLQDLTLPVYNFISCSSTSMSLLLGDFIYSLLRRPENEREDAIERYLREIVADCLPDHPRVLEAHRDFILKTMPVVERAGRRTIERILAEDPDMVGFTIGAYQLCAGLYLAQKLKEAAPEKQVWFGGSFCTGQVGYHLFRYFSFVDVMFTGESEKSLAAALESLENGKVTAEINGVVTRAAGMREEGVPDEKLCPELVEDLDELPVPDYSDYFDAMKKYDEAAKITPSLLMETSRGCWWAQKGPCRFCGLNMQTKAFRTKSAGRVLEEISHQLGKYGTNRIVMVDNVLNRAFFKDLFPLLKERFRNLRIFYEVRCELSREELMILRDAGVSVVQGGVEAIDDELLGLLRKGTHSWQNLQLVKWCEELDIQVRYNLLYAIPGEPAEAYKRSLALMRSIHHLKPPRPTRIHLDRNSVYDLEGKRFGIYRSGVNPASFVHCFPEPQIDPLLITHCFANGLERLDPLLPVLWGEFIDEIGAWHDDYYHKGKKLYCKINEGKVRISDSRFSEEVQCDDLDGVEAAIVIFCDSARSKKSILESMPHFSAEEINKGLERLCKRKILYRLEDRYISLAVGENPDDSSRRRAKRTFKDESHPLLREIPETSKDFPWLVKNSSNLFGFKYRYKHLYGNPEAIGGQDGN